MKKTGLEIVEMIARGEAPNKIKYNKTIFDWDKELKNYFNDLDVSVHLLGKLNDDFEIIKEEQKVWKPKEGEFYYYIDDDGGIAFKKWQGIYTDLFRYRTGNCFKTYEETEKVLEKIKIYMQLKIYALEHNTEKINWHFGMQKKYYIEYDNNNKKIDIYYCRYSKSICKIYFTSEDECKQAIEEIGRDNIKKLFEEE